MANRNVNRFACMALCFGLSWMCMSSAYSQDLRLFFPSSQLESTEDEYGNVYSTGPADGVIPFPENFGETPELTIEGLLVDPAYLYEEFTDEAGNSYTTTAVDESLSPEEVFTEENIVDDNLWILRGGAMPDMGVLASRAPAETEDAPQLRTSVTMAQGGEYNVYLWYGDINTTTEEDDAANPTPIVAHIEGNDSQTFFQADGTLVTDEYGWNILEASLGTVTVEDGGSFSVLIDDHFGLGARSAYLGLRISEGGPTAPAEQPLLDFNTDDKWMTYSVAGQRTLVLSNGPGSSEDAPMLTTEITLAHAGTYEVIFQFMDSEQFPDEGWIEASLNDGDFEEYGAYHVDAVRATGGTSPPYPWIDHSYQGNMFWYTAVMGEVTVEGGDTITIRVDDVQDTSQQDYIASVFEGVTLRVLEGGPPITDIQVSTEFRYEWGEDDRGNRYQIVAADESLTEDQVFSETRDGSDNLWELRQPNMGPYGVIYSGFNPAGTEDCPMLKTMVEVADGGTYDVYMYVGDVAEVGTDDLESPQPIMAGFSSDDLTTYLQADGEFIGLYGFNVLKTYIGTVTLEDGELLEVFIDDAPEVEGNDRRSNYGGLILELSDDTSVKDWSLF